jgi:hypothetical protein
MTHLTKASVVGLLALGLPGTLAAQQPNARAQAANNAANEGLDQDRHLILHAVNKAIDGTGLEFAAHLARGGRHQDDHGRQEADNRRDRGDDNRRDRRDDDRQGDNQDRRRDQRADQQLAGQLEQQARQEFAASDRLLDAAGNDTRPDAGADADRPDDRTAWTHRLHAAANQYTNTLRSLAGVREHDDRASGSEGTRGQGDADQDRRNDRADRDRADRSDSNRNAQQHRRLNRGDVARVLLINHAVRLATEAYFVNQGHDRRQGNDADSRHGPSQRHRERARQLEADSNQILQRVQASASRQDDDDNRRDQDRDQNRRDREQEQRNRDRDQQDRDRNQQDRDQDQQGQASVRELAQQGQRLIDSLQRINASESRGR